MAMSEQFSLRWNDFHANLSHAFHALLEGEDLVDVTLAAGGHYVHAHKLILSVCSPYFKELFKMNPCEHPIVILKDVAHSELRQLLQFMYRGEVHVRQQDLSAFLHTAELLQVKGLSAGREKSESPIPENTGTIASDSSVKGSATNMNDAYSPFPNKGSVMSDGDSVFQSKESMNNDGVYSSKGSATGGDDTPPLVRDDSRSPLKRLLKRPSPRRSHPHPHKVRPQPAADAPPAPAPAAATATPPHSVDNDKYEYASDNETLIDCDSELYHSVLDIPESAKESYNKQEGWNCKSSGVKCPSCHRFFANRYNLKVHIRDKHDTLEGTLHCEICNKRMRNPSCLRVHMYHHRKQAASLAASAARPPPDLALETTTSKWPSDTSLSAGAGAHADDDLRERDSGGAYAQD